MKQLVHLVKFWLWTSLGLSSNPLFVLLVCTKFWWYISTPIGPSQIGLLAEFGLISLFSVSQILLILSIFVETLQVFKMCIILNIQLIDVQNHDTLNVSKSNLLSLASEIISY